MKVPIPGLWSTILWYFFLKTEPVWKKSLYFLLPGYFKAQVYPKNLLQLWKPLFWCTAWHARAELSLGRRSCWKTRRRKQKRRRREKRHSGGLRVLAGHTSERWSDFNECLDYQIPKRLAPKAETLTSEAPTKPSQNLYTPSINLQSPALPNIEALLITCTILGVPYYSYGL